MPDALGPMLPWWSVTAVVALMVAASAVFGAATGRWIDTVAGAAAIGMTSLAAIRAWRFSDPQGHSQPAERLARLPGGVVDRAVRTMQQKVHASADLDESTSAMPIDALDDMPLIVDTGSYASDLARMPRGFLQRRGPSAVPHLELDLGPIPPHPGTAVAVDAALSRLRGTAVRGPDRMGVFSALDPLDLTEAMSVDPTAPAGPEALAGFARAVRQVLGHTEVQSDTAPVELAAETDVGAGSHAEAVEPVPEEAWAPTGVPDIAALDHETGEVFLCLDLESHAAVIAHPE